MRTWAVILFALGCGHAAAADLNARGERAYAASQLDRARALFEEAQKKTPENPAVWLNWARVVVRTKPEIEMGGGCVADTPWEVRALLALDRAVALSREDTLAKIDADAALADLKVRPGYTAWRAVFDARDSDGAVNALLRKLPDWHIETPMPSVPSAASLLKHGWRVENRAVLVPREGWEERLTFTVVHWAWNQGNSRLSRLMLSGTDRVEWYAGLLPEWDCPY